MRPDRVFDTMFQHERTALAWGAPAIATLVAGALLARHAVSVHRALAVVGIAQLMIGARGADLGGVPLRPAARTAAAW